MMPSLAVPLVKKTETKSVSKVSFRYGLRSVHVRGPTKHSILLAASVEILQSCRSMVISHYPLSVTVTLI